MRRLTQLILTTIMAGPFLGAPVRADEKKDGAGLFVPVPFGLLLVRLGVVARP